MNDTRFQRVEEEYQALRNAQNTIMNGLEQSLPAIVTAIEQNRQGIEQNRQGIEQNRQGIEQNRQGIEQNRQAIAVLDSKINALIQHFEVDYKPPMGFAPE